MIVLRGAAASAAAYFSDDVVTFPDAYFEVECLSGGSQSTLETCESKLFSGSIKIAQRAEGIFILPEKSFFSVRADRNHEKKAAGRAQAEKR